MNNHMDKSLFFLTISFVCIWLVVDVAFGKNRLGAFLSTIFPFMNDGESETISQEQIAEDTANAEKKAENAPSSAAISGAKKYSVPGYTGPLEYGQSGTGINTVPYGATRPGVNE